MDPAGEGMTWYSLISSWAGGTTCLSIWDSCLAEYHLIWFPKSWLVGALDRNGLLHINSSEFSPGRIITQQGPLAPVRHPVFAAAADQKAGERTPRFHGGCLMWPADSQDSGQKLSPLLKSGLLTTGDF